MKEDGDPSSFKINASEASAIPMSTDKEQPTGSEPSFGLRVALQATESFESRRVLGPLATATAQCAEREPQRWVEHCRPSHGRGHRRDPWPQYAFKVSMFNVSCNSH
jgi:hypothetical protein